MEQTIDIEGMKAFVFASIISAENEEYSEEVKQEIMRRYGEDKTNWKYILEPIEDEECRHRLIELLTYESRET